MFKCDTARISQPCGTYYFLVLGWNKHSEGKWHAQDGKPINFDYVHEQVVAAGNTLRQLVASAKHYENKRKKLCQFKMT